MPKIKYRLYKILGSWVLGFGAGLAATTPLHPDFPTQVFISFYGGFVTVIPQIGKMLDELGERYKRER